MKTTSRAMAVLRTWRKAIPGLVLCLATLLAISQPAYASAPVLQSPAAGSSFAAESPPTFTVVDSPPADSGSVYIRISSSPAVNADGDRGRR